MGFEIAVYGMESTQARIASSCLLAPYLCTETLHVT